jgi:tetratricopeptide (TPR) repeat protein
MSDKKKIAPAKTTDKRMHNSQPTKGSKGSESPRAAVPARPGGATAPQTANADKQLGTFEAAIKLFHARKFKEAREQFLRAADGPERDVAHRARLHATMCERRFEQPAVNLRTAEEHYNYGVALLNTRKVEEARTHLGKALEMAPDSDHVLYALALVQALAGDAAGAHDHLKRAIELEPKNRIMARQDTDFATLAGQPQFQALLYPEKKSW